MCGSDMFIFTVYREPVTGRSGVGDLRIAPWRRCPFRGFASQVLVGAHSSACSAASAATSTDLLDYGATSSQGQFQPSAAALDRLVG